MCLDSKGIDILGRENTIQDLYNIIQSASKNNAYCSFAIEGNWGIGKTFILEKLEEKLEVEINQETGQNRYFVFHYNCWKYDYYDEPAIAIVSALKDKVDAENCVQIVGTIKDSWKIAKNIVNNMAKEIVKNKIGIDIVQVCDDIVEEGNNRKDKEREFDSLFAFKRTLDHVRKQIKELANDKTVVIVVDELDRCMPNYAIKVLERLHHIFEKIDNVLLIIAVDSNQLNQSIREIYGESVDTEHYLKKFISFNYKIDVGNTQKSAMEKFQNYFQEFIDYQNVEETLIEFMQLSQLEVRTLEKIIEKSKLIHGLICNSKVSNSVLLYEVICSILEYICKNSKDDEVRLDYSGDLYWIPDINLTIYISLDDCIGDGLLQFIKDLVANAEGIQFFMNNNLKSINMSPEGICVGYMDYILAKKKKLKFAPITEVIEDEIEICKRFSDMCKIIN